MKRINYLWIISIIISILIVFAGQTGFSDDTCVFMTTADDVPPNIVILLDNGAEMKHTVWPVDYNDSVDYTPNVTPQVDIVPNGELGGGNGFYNENGYGIYITGGRYFLVPVGDNLELITDVRLEGLPSIDKKTSSWEINGVTVHLPAEGSTVVDADGVKDNAGTLRYSKNYLNWLFFYSSSVDLNGDNVPEPIYDGSLLPDKSRFYYAKKALMTVAKLAANQAQFGIHNFTSNADGASNVQPLKMVVQEPLATFPENNILISEYINNINNMATVTYSPIAEGLATVAGYYGSPSAGVVGEYCQKNFVIVVSPGISSEDQAPASQSTPASLSDYDDDAAAGGVGEGNIKENETIYSIPIRQNGSTYLDDVAHYLYSNDVVGYQHGLQNVMTYTIGFMGDHFGNLYLKNTSNNGNGNLNLYDTTHEEYGKYHYEAQDPNELSSVLLAAIKEILSGTSSFTAPVVPVTRTTSGNRIYMAFFKPLESNFWEGNVTKFGIADDNTIIDANDKPATWPNGAIRADAIPFWQTKDWADPTKSNYINYSARNIYTYMGDDKNLADPTTNNAFTADNLDAAALGYPTHTTTEIIDYVRGADVFDEDGDGTTDENRIVITGDVLHSEPVVVQYTYTNGTSETMVYFGANDGMLHAVWDQTDPNVDIKNNEINHGKEAWAFIPPDQLHRLKDMVEGSSHQYYVDSSPKVYFDDENEDGLVDTDRDKIILICGERKGGTSYFALDVTDPMTPKYMWRIGSGNDNIIISYDARTLDFGVYNWLGDLTTAIYNDYMPDQTSDPFVWGQIVSSITTDTQTGILELANIKRHARGSLQIGDTLRLWSVATFEWHDAATVVGNEPNLPDVIIPELGESWSEPQFGLVKNPDSDTGETAVFFIGAGYSSDNSSGAAVLAIDVFTGQVVKKFKNDDSISGMDYSIASSVTTVDEDGNGFVDKVYVGDLGGQMWRIGKFTDTSDKALSFPESDENILNWGAKILFVSDPVYERKFFYPPAVTLEKGYDLVFAGTGNREDACNISSYNRIYSIKDTHTNSMLTEDDLVDVTNPADPVPNLDNQTGDVDRNYNIDQGWYVRLASGEKVLAEGTVFYKIFYLTTFTSNNDPCLPGGYGKIYALNYKTAAASINFDVDTDLERSVNIGGGIPSKIVTVITDAGGAKLLVSVGSTNPDANSESFEAGVVTVDPLVPPVNFFYMWWREVLKL